MDADQTIIPQGRFSCNMGEGLCETGPMQQKHGFPVGRPARDVFEPSSFDLRISGSGLRLAGRRPSCQQGRSDKTGDTDPLDAR